ncbi:MAG TPA: hypothetical protein VGX68_10240 [Thermoanaerobaculia bacterium]|jgi:hypothetical protein|nr:hypothetical protein [Thermoanaerobaculia bacterium]
MANDPARSASPEERRLLAGRAVPAGLCESCEHLRVLASRRSVFVRCGLADTDPRFPRYPALPVTACAGYRQEDRPCS